MSTKIDLKFDHLGLATRNADETSRMLSALGYELAKPLYDPLQNVNLIWCEHASMPAIEVVYPADSPGPLDAYLADYSEMVYHLCYVASDIQSALDAMKAAGLRVLPVVAPKPAVLFSGRNVGFYMAKGIGLIEILEEK